MTILGLPNDQHDFGMAKGHSPIADKVVCVDFDGTLVPWGPLMGRKDLLPGAAEALMELQEAGYTVVIWTSRMSRTWAGSVVGVDPVQVDEFLIGQRKYIISTLRRGAPYFKVTTMTSEKIPAECYIDDKAVGFRGDWAKAMKDVNKLLGPKP